MWADPAVVKHLSGSPSTEQATWFRLLRYAGLWPLLGYGYWAVEEQSSGTFVGDVGFADFKRDIEPAVRNVPELGWVLAAAMHGKGYATEAVRAAIEWASQNFEDPRIVCIIAPENSASIRVAQKAGFLEYARTAFMGDPTLMFERLV